MCVSPAFVSMGAKGSHGPGPGQARTQYACMKESRAFQGPGRCRDRPCLASHKRGKPRLLLCQLWPRAIAGLDGRLHFLP